MKDIVAQVIKEYIDDIVKESKGLITERVSSVVYHWTSPQTALAIINSNRFSLMNNLFKNAESNIVGTSHNRMWYMSLTRNGKIGMGGYSNSGDTWVRFTLDGDKLNSQFHTKAIDYWGATMGKQSIYTMYDKVRKPGSETEAEDRLYSNKPFIEDAWSYILSVDICFDIAKYESVKDKPYNYINPSTVETLVTVTLKASKKCKIYTSVKDFNMGKNPISVSEFSNWFREGGFKKDLDTTRDGSRDKLDGTFIASILYIVNFPNGTFKDCMNTLKTYGLEKYAKQVVQAMNGSYYNGSYWFGDKSRMDDKDIKRMVFEHFERIELGNLAQSLNREDLAKAFQILSDFCHKHKVKTKYDIANYFINLMNASKIETNKESYTVTCVRIPDYTRYYLCLDTNRSKFKDVFKKGDDILRNIFDDLTYYVENHKSNSDKQFKKYLYRLLIQGNPSVQDIIDLYDKLKSLGNERMDSYYKPEVQTASVSNFEVYYTLKHESEWDGEWTSLQTLDTDFNIYVTDKNQYVLLRELIKNQ